MKAYKGFEKGMKCRGFQFEEGKTYEEKTADLCHSGFHACERPLDVFAYYPPASSVFHVVELDEVSDQREKDSKVCAKKITVGAALDVFGLVKAHIEYTKEHTTKERTNPRMATAGDSGAATAGSYGAATAGSYGAATAGHRGAATAGHYGAATAGDGGAATAGFYGAATAGDRGAATAGDSGAATAGFYGAATSRGKTSVGKNGAALVRGNAVRIRGGLGALLVIAEEKQDSYDLEAWKAIIVDGETVKADTWYQLKNGELVECEENE